MRHRDVLKIFWRPAFVLLILTFAALLFQHFNSQVSLFFSYQSLQRLLFLNYMTGGTMRRLCSSCRLSLGFRGSSIRGELFLCPILIPKSLRSFLGCITPIIWHALYAVQSQFGRSEFETIFVPKFGKVLTRSYQASTSQRA